MISLPHLKIRAGSSEVCAFKFKDEETHRLITDFSNYDFKLIITQRDDSKTLVKDITPYTVDVDYGEIVFRLKTRDTVDIPSGEYYYIFFIKYPSGEIEIGVGDFTVLFGKVVSWQ